MSETKFGVLASLCYFLAFVAAAAAIIFTVSGSSNLRVDTSLYIGGAVGLVVWGFIFHAFHTSTLRRDALLLRICNAVEARGTVASDEPTEAWLIGQRQKR
jgi:hypothetical protein